MGTRVIFHKNCVDGYTAAWIANAFSVAGSRDFSFFECGYSGRDKFIEENFEKFVGEDVLLLDFSFKKAVLLKLAAVCKSILILDHHETAKRDLAGLDFARFDITECGATLTWKYFNPDSEVPKFVQYVKDYDLWKFELLHSKEVNAFIRSFPYTTPNWDKINGYIITRFQDVVDQGSAILRSNNCMIEMLIEHAKSCWIMGHKAVAVNCTMLVNEVADKLKDNADVVIIHGDNNKGGTFVSLRSKEVDVSKIAEYFGGGGHKHSSSFTEEFHTPHVWEMYSEMSKNTRMKPKE